MEKQFEDKCELKYGGCRIITGSVEACLLNVSFDKIGEPTILEAVAEDFFSYLKEIKLDQYWDCFEISSIITNEHGNAAMGAKFVFTRLLSKKHQLDSLSMGNGTQWVSDVFDLMKGFLPFARKLDEKNGTSDYLTARLIFRIEGKQIEWR